MSDAYVGEQSQTLIISVIVNSRSNGCNSFINRSFSSFKRPRFATSYFPRASERAP